MQIEMNSLTNVYQDAITRQKRDQLVLDHLEYVRQICGTMARRLPDHADIENLHSAGVVGLIEAAQNYDESQGTSFKTYSYRRIRGAIVDEIRRTSPLSQQAMQQVAKVKAELERLEPPVAPETLARNLGMTLEEIEEGLFNMRIAYPVHLDEFNGVDQSSFAPDDILEQREQVQHLATAIEHLEERDRMVVQLYYLEELRLKEIGQVLGISESRVSRILNRAEFRLKENIRQLAQ